MAPREPIEPIVDDEGEGEFELIHLEEGQSIPEDKGESALEPEGVTLTRAEYEALLEKTNSTAELSRGLAGLGEIMSRPQAQMPANAPALPIFDPDAVEEEAFKPKGFTSAVKKVLASEMGGLQASMARALQDENKRLLKIDPTTKETFVAYEKEIEERVSTLPPEYRFNPKIYEQVHRQVMLDHLDEIASKRAESMVAEQVKIALEQAGITPGASAATVPKRTAMYQEGASRAPMPRAKKPIYFLPKEREDFVAQGGNLEDKVQVAAYLATKGRM